VDNKEPIQKLMMKSIGKLTLATILAALVVGVPLVATAQDKAAPTNAAPVAPAKPHAIPFHGKLGSVDKVNKTITLDDKNKRTLEVISTTKIMKAGKPALLDDAVVGEDVAGQYMKSEDGKLVAKSLRFGPKPEAAPAK
jgi:hypothetical protein